MSTTPTRDAEPSPAHTDIPLVELEPEVPEPVVIPFPSNSAADTPPESSSSLQTQSDKLSELPPSTPPGGRGRTTSRPRRGDASVPVYSDTQSLNLLPAGTRTSESDDKEPPKRRVSFDSDRASLPSFQNVVRQAVARVGRATGSDHAHGSPSKDFARSGSAQSHSPSRNQSPLRMFWPLNRIHSREEPFVPVDPYSFLFCDKVSRKRDTISHFLDQFVRQVYRHILLRLPSIYFTRVCRLFSDAEVSRPEIMRMIEGVQRGAEFPIDWRPPTVSPALSRFKHSWEEFVDSVMREWKTLNVVSALLLSAILTIFQIEGAANNQITRTAALLSLVAALWSLTFGCVYILRFGTMRSMYRASRWAEEAQKSKTSILWNVWVLLATPAIWLAWSMIFFCVAILAFVWTTGSSVVQSPPSPRAELGPRIAITSVFALGCVYFGMVVHTFQSYGGANVRARHSYGHWHRDTPAHRGEDVGGGVGDVHESEGAMREERDVEKGDYAQEERGRKISPKL